MISASSLLRSFLIILADGVWLTLLKDKYKTWMDAFAPGSGVTRASLLAILLYYLIVGVAHQKLARDATSALWMGLYGHAAFVLTLRAFWPAAVPYSIVFIELAFGMLWSLAVFHIANKQW